MSSYLEQVEGRVNYWVWRTWPRESGCEMNPYLMLGSGVGTNEATSLSVRLSTWHDATVAHERRLQTGRTSDLCNDECPHAEARVLWSEALATFGPRAHDLTFLRSRAKESPRSTGGAVAREPISEAADTGHHPEPRRGTQGRRPRAAVAAGARAAAEL